MQKSKQKRKLAKEPQAEEAFRRCQKCHFKIDYEDTEDFNYELIDDICYATERIKILENGFIKGIITGALIVGIAWLISIF